MPLVNVSEIIDDADFVQSFTIKRSSYGNWSQGFFPEVTQVIESEGVLIPQNTKDMVQTPDGDTIRGGVDIYTRCQLYVTHKGTLSITNATSDELLWMGDDYKVIQSQNYSDYGYYHSIAVRTMGA